MEGLLFYRCILCGAVVSVWDVRENQGCRKCGNTRIRPSDLSVWEKLVQIARHPKIWRWDEEAL